VRFTTWTPEVIDLQGKNGSYRLPFLDPPSAEIAGFAVWTCRMWICRDRISISRRNGRQHSATRRDAAGWRRLRRLYFSFEDF